MSKRLAIVIAAVVSLLVIVGTIAVVASPSAQTQNVSVSLTAQADEFRIVYTATISNPGTTTISDVYAAINIPSGGSFVEVTATPAGGSALGKQGNEVGWLINQIAAGGSVKVAYKASVAEKEAGPVHAWVRWNRPTAGNTSSADLAFASVYINTPKRGCTDCHTLRDATTGAVTIAYEALHRGGSNHPKISFDTTVEGCLACHAPGTGEREGMGVVAPKMLRAIVHPAHLNSPSFTGTYKGNCFTCHEVDGQGRFTLLGVKLDKDFRGIPSQVPVKGIPPSEGK